MQIADSLANAITDARAAASTAGESLFSAVFWFGVAETLFAVALTVVLALVVLGVIKRVKKRWVDKALAEPGLDHRRQRVLTVADLLGSVARYVVWAITTVTVLSEVGVEIGPILASAGIVGLAVGFGAQTLVKDVISGFFLLFDDTLGYGDLVTFNGKTGTVEYIGLRLIKVRAFDGELMMIPAGEMRVFGNKSVGYARVIVNVGLSYEQDVSRALETLEAIATEWAATDAARAILVEEKPQVQALTDLGDSAVTARIIVQVRPGEQFQAERDLRRLLKQRFDERGIEIPFPRRTVYVRNMDASEPAGTSDGDDMDDLIGGAAGGA